MDPLSASSLPMGSSMTGLGSSIPISSSLSMNTSAVMREVEGVFWGTSIRIADVQRRFRQFLTEYQHIDYDEPKYQVLLRNSILSGSNELEIDCQDLFEFDADLYLKLVQFPYHIFSVVDDLINNELIANNSSTPIAALFYNLREHTLMRSLKPQILNRYVSIQGMVTRVSRITPEPRVVFFECANRCGFSDQLSGNAGVFHPPKECPRCRAVNSLKPVYNRSFYDALQIIQVQEAPEQLPDGATPHTVIVHAYNQMVETVVPGDRVLLTGIFKASGMRINAKMRTQRSVFATYIDALHIRKDTQRKIFNDENMNFDVDKVQQYYALSRRSDCYEILTRNLAPSIFGHDDVKKGLLCQLFGAVRKELTGIKVRPEINILLVGDPGTAKSQLLQHVHQLSPRGIYTSGKGSSAVGLTAYVTKDQDTGEHVLESGALVLSDLGICCIDEFDKASKQTTTILHEAMEQGTISVAKAGIIATLNARTSILAAANPIESKYNPRLSVSENINMIPTLLSRFDLVYLILDVPDEEEDRRLAKHIVSLFYDEREESISDNFDVEFLAEYISYARQKINPKLTPEAAEVLRDGYVDLRGVGKQSGAITATLRQLESLIRIAESLARMEYQEEVTREHVKEAIRLMKSAFQSSATDSRGILDMDALLTGHSAEERRTVKRIAEMIVEAFKRVNVTEMGREALLRQISTDGIRISLKIFAQSLEYLRADNLIGLRGDKIRFFKDF
eukprot:TRINITY_DN657_c0_g1_i1.p1 TRINITY_DN657_c0_g1~~TRINITY_DN657_c0_g1_i1.p1  ORF type:complete len:735 (+),score=169.63 TRINITY_DN657_c0_g1_i1:61-2265(+)